MAETYDVVIIGGGPGGYNCAIRAGQLGLKVACIESRGKLGGTCLNVSCIPSKALLHTSDLFRTAQEDFESMGIKTGKLDVDIEKMIAQKDGRIVSIASSAGEVVFPNLGPYYHTSKAGVIQLTRYMGLGGQGPKVECLRDQREDPDSAINPERYLAESITSETEFVISNGRAKLLRLPIGTYTYELHGLPDDQNSWDNAAANGPKSVGTVQWNKGRPQPVIKTW